MGNLAMRSSLVFFIAALCGCSPKVELRYILAPSFGVAEQLTPTAGLGFLLAVKSVEPLYIPCSALGEQLSPFHFILDYWDPVASSFRPVGKTRCPQPIDHGPHVIQVSNHVFMVRTDLSAFTTDLGNLLEAGEIRCRIRLPLCSYDERRRCFVYHTSALSDSFVIAIENNTAIDIRRDKATLYSPGGLSLDEAQNLVGFAIDYDTLDRGMESDSKRGSIGVTSQ